MTTPTPAATSMDTWLRRYATQATAALSAVVGITGILMFFHVAKADMEAMHEWLGVGFVAVAVGHVVRHSHGFVAMLGQTRMRILLGAAMAAALSFIAFASPKGVNPFRQSAQMVMTAPLKDLAPLVGVPADALAARLRSAGVAAADTTQSIDSIARAQGADPVKLLGAALAKPH